MYRFKRTSKTIITICFGMSVLRCVMYMLQQLIVSNNHPCPLLSRRMFDTYQSVAITSRKRFLGQLLTNHTDAFYWYEPLWNYDSGVYYWGPNLICAEPNVCGIAINKTRHSIGRVHFTFNNIYRCNFTGLEEAVAEPLTWLNSGISWEHYRQCRGSDKVVACLRQFEETCKTSKHRATKTVRLTLSNMFHILENNRNLKLIHLMRDPRAIMNSRIQTDWFGVRESKLGNFRAVRQEAKDLCNRIKYDLKVSQKLKEMYTDRFSFVMFEDLLENLENVRILYKYFGIGQILSEIELLSFNTFGRIPNKDISKGRKDYRDWWRGKLTFDAMKVIDSVCYRVLPVLGYRTFRTESDLRNMSVLSYKFTNQLLLNNIFSTESYNFNFDK